MTYSCTVQMVSMWLDAWSTLPRTALINILEHSGLQERLHDHAMVCKNWAEAAAAATTSISLHPCHDMESVQRFLHQHGASVTSLQLLEAGGQQLQRLPCPGLVDLVLLDCRMEDPDASQACLFTDLAAATRLTRLGLMGVDVLENAEGAGDLYAAVARLRSLRDLVLVYVTEPLAEDQPPQHRFAPARAGGALPVPSTLLQHMQHLTRLFLQEGIVQSSTQHLNTLTKLRYLHLEDHWNGLQLSAVSGLQALQALSYLKLAQDCAMRSSAPAVLGQLTRLQRLELAGLATKDDTVPLQLQANVLKHTMKLLAINLGGVNVVDGAAGVAEFLALMARHQQLTELKLAGLEVYAQHDCPASAYSAFTASSGLEHLSLRLAGHVTTIKPIWRHVFPEDRQLEYLTSLELADKD